MRILHCCLASFYIDDFGYQENILPKMHKIQGHEVAILASTETYLNNSKLSYTKPKEYFTREGIPIKRIPYVKWLPHVFGKKIRLYDGVREYVRKFQPDIIFIHDHQFLSISSIVHYKSKNPSVKIFVDGHADFTNTNLSWISIKILHGLLYKFCAKLIEPHVEKFYGTLPCRVDFINSVYKINKKKIELLVMGADDLILNNLNRNLIRKEIRFKTGINQTDFVIVTGGKINKQKNIHLLIQAVSELGLDNLKLLVFGSVDNEVTSEIEKYSTCKSIVQVGWIPSEDSYKYFIASDLACFPGKHSVLWEQAVGSGIPGIFLKILGHEHIDIGGNVVFLENTCVETIKSSLRDIVNNSLKYNQMLNIARTKGIEYFSYYKIAEKSIAI